MASKTLAEARRRMTPCLPLGDAQADASAARMVSSSLIGFGGESLTFRPGHVRDGLLDLVPNAAVADALCDGLPLAGASRERRAG
ncbi:MAG: hypothetical protein D1H97_15640 [Paracoccus sp. BP8]|nr:MAG: hypothetical protein D1H97_15640 [Paracoccus sp. BP8]